MQLFVPESPPQSWYTEQNANSQVQLVSNSSADTAYQDLPATNTVTQTNLDRSHFTNTSFRFNRRTEGLRVLGVSMEDTTGGCGR